MPAESSAEGTRTLDGPAPAGGATVSLTSSDDMVATVPVSVTVPENTASANFRVSTDSVSTPTTVTVSASYDGVTKAAELTVTPPPDTVSIIRAEYTTSKGQLRVEATSSEPSATPTVHVTSTGELIGTLTVGGGGKHRGQFSWPVNPHSITVGSDHHGSATTEVSIK